MFLFNSKHISFSVGLKIENVMKIIAQNACEYNTGDSDFLFYGTVSACSFEIQSALSSGRRGLFNPILTGVVESKDETTSIEIDTKYNKANYFYIAIMILFCILLGIISFFRLEHTDYLFLAFIIPAVIFAFIFSFIYIAAYMNLDDSKTNIAGLFKDSLLI